MQKIWKSMRSVTKYDLLWWGIILLGVFLRLYQYFLNRSFWRDEASLALNIVDRSFGELMTLLDYHQAAPVGFLFVERFLILIFGNHDYVFRLFPLFAGILSIFIIYRLSRDHIGVAGLFSVLMFSISWWLIYYSSELKQYSGDVMIALLLVYLAGKCIKENVRSKDFILLGVVGFLVIWFSHPSVFTLAGVGLLLVVEKFSRKKYVPWIWILGIGAGWLVSFGLEYLVSLRHIVADGYLIDYWIKTYPPLPPWHDFEWYLNTYYYFLFYTITRADNLMALVTLFFTAVGALSLFIRKWKVAILFVSPLIITIIVSALQKYPLKGRFTLFITPFLLLLFAEGFRGIYGLVAKRNPKVASVFSGFLALLVVWSLLPVNIKSGISNDKDDIRPVLQHVAEHSQPDDIVYVYYRASPVVQYYQFFYKFGTDKIVYGEAGSTKRRTIESYEDDVHRLVGNQRVWFIFAGVYDCPNCDEEDTLSFYLEYIDNVGVPVDGINGVGANAFLYDLSP